MDRFTPLQPHEATPTPADSPLDDRADDPQQAPDADAANPPHTTTGHITSPKFGSAGSGGAEFEPAPGT